MFYVLVSINFCRLQNFKISILNFEILVNALKLSVVICILLFCLNSVTQIGITALLISWLVVLFFLTQRLIFFQEMVGYLSVTYFFRQAKTV